MIRCPHCDGVLVSQDPLTKVQAALYKFLVSFVHEQGYAPSYNEIKDKFGYSSYGTVNEYLNALETKGYIRRARNEVRAITCLVHPDELGVVAASVRARRE